MQQRTFEFGEAYHLICQREIRPIHRMEFLLIIVHHFLVVLVPGLEMILISLLSVASVVHIEALFPCTRELVCSHRQVPSRGYHLLKTKTLSRLVEPISGAAKSVQNNTS